MKTNRRIEWKHIIILEIMVCIIACAVYACADKYSPEIESAVDVADYTEQQKKCIYEAGSPNWFPDATTAQRRSLIDQCRCGVHEEHQRPCIDASSPRTNGDL